LNWVDWIGGFAGVFVVLAFYARRPVRLRMLAITSNVLFIAYAALAGLWPVLVLHAVLLPRNAVRLREERRGAFADP
jgi:CRP/FNR family transcriptional regulator, cyclic AMP receptor protein